MLIKNNKTIYLFATLLFLTWSIQCSSGNKPQSMQFSEEQKKQLADALTKDKENGASLDIDDLNYLTSIICNAEKKVLMEIISNHEGVQNQVKFIIKPRNLEVLKYLYKIQCINPTIIRKYLSSCNQNSKGGMDMKQSIAAWEQFEKENNFYESENNQDTFFTNQNYIILFASIALGIGFYYYNYKRLTRY